MPRKALKILVVAVGVAASFAAHAEDIAAFEARISAELEATSPAAAKDFREANRARESGEFARAAALYAAVYEEVPSFVHALRRQCSCEIRRTNRPAALKLCEAAVAQERTPENLVVLATALVEPGRGPMISPAEGARASELVEEAVRLAPDEANIHMSAAAVALRRTDIAALGRHADRLEDLAPDDVGTWVLATYAALGRERFARAQAALDRACDTGLDVTGCAALQAQIDEVRPVWDKWLRLGGLVLGVWLAAAVVLLGVGAALSRLTLRAAVRPASRADGRAVGLGGALRRSYAAVLWLTCAYYYLSMPLLILLVVGGGGGILYAFYAAGRIPVKLGLVILVGVLVTVGAVLKSLFVRGGDGDPGERLDLDAHPRLKAVLREAAEAVGTRPVDAVYLTPGTDMAVFERGSVLEQMSGTRERCLILGVGLLEGLEVGPFKAILAHEYGHLTNEDTAGGGFALAVRRSLAETARTLDANGAAQIYNPVWLFINVFDMVFLRVSQGATRLQEILADRWAAFAYGPRAFTAGLRHAIERSIRFDGHVNATLDEVIEGGGTLANLYAYRPSEPPPEDEIREAIEAAIHAAPSPYDSHPAPADRFTWVEALSGTPPGEVGGGPVWDLFADREALERHMTDGMRVVLAAQGLAIPDEVDGGIEEDGGLEADEALAIRRAGEGMG